MKSKRILALIMILTMLLSNGASVVLAQSYTYDPLGRVISTTYDDGYKEVYTYDAGGNMIASTIDASGVINVSIDGKAVAFDQIPVVVSGRTMVPLRAIFEVMGATIEWNDKTKTVTAVKQGITVVMQINNKVIKVNGKAVTLEVAPMVIAGRTMVPARAVAESLNADVNWDKVTRTVLITQK